MTSSTGAPISGPSLLLRVRVQSEPGCNTEFEFRDSFTIGRVEECDVCVPNEYVSRAHAKVTFENGRWSVRDLNSSNGIYINGKRTKTAVIEGTCLMRLGVEGPFVSLELERPVPTPSPVPPPRPVVPPSPAASPGAITTPNATDASRSIDRYFDNSPAGEHTMLVRQAIARGRKKQTQKFRWVLICLALLIVGLGAYTLYLHQEAKGRRAMAEQLFYSMKALDVNVANVEKLVMETHTEKGMEEIRKYREQRREMANNYDRFLASLRIYDSKLTERRRLILRIARIFGECELALPADFESEIDNYIEKWRSSGRLAQGLRTAQENGYTVPIVKQLLDQNLAPQFFYLALQESGFDAYISGPETRKGIAKGMWQFIPTTAIKYGLRVGPLVDLRRPDPADDRHHWDRETKAAVQYMKDLYSTDAQASGLLVMACYNWGEDYVLPLVRKMPANPRDRNFWRLLASYKDKLPKETYDYVFYIVSAAVIGENPRLFGFDFDNPLGAIG